MKAVTDKAEYGADYCLNNHETLVWFPTGLLEGPTQFPIQWYLG
jgi:hypothetical protein